MNNVYDPDDCVSETGVVKCNECDPRHCFDHHDECRLTMEGECVKRETKKEGGDKKDKKDKEDKKDKKDKKDKGDKKGKGDKKDKGDKERFGNILSGYEFDDTCMGITIIFIILFMYKEEIMGTKIIKNLLK